MIGDKTEANPPLFIHMRALPVKDPSFADLVDAVQRCRESCDDIRKKTCAATVVLHQIQNGIGRIHISEDPQ